MALPFSGHGVTLGGLRLVDWGEPVTYDEGYTFEISADGTTWGNPQVVVSSLISALSDGEIVQQQRAGNREPVLYVRITGTDHFGLVAGDTALGAVVGKPCELVWQPPDADAPPTVIDVVHSRMDHQWDDLDALKFQRVWTVTMSALPWPRSAEKVITPAFATAAAVVVDDGTSTTSWTSLGGSLSTSSGAVVSTYDPRIATFGGFGGSALVRTASIDTSSHKYVAIDYKSSLPGYHAFREPGGPNLAEVRREPAPDGFTRSWFKVGDSTNSLSSIYLDILHPVSAATSATLSISQVQTANALPHSGTVRQIARTVDPEGNVPAEGTITVSHPTAGLGKTIVYSHPTGGGYSPPLRPWLAVSEPPTTDSTRISGKYQSLATATDYSIPTASVPQGDVQLWAAILLDTAATCRIYWSADTWVGGVQVGTRQAGSTLVTATTALEWMLVPLARLTLPTAKTAQNAGAVRISILRDPDTPTINAFLDEAWLFAMDKGRLTVVDCGTGAPTAAVVHNVLRVGAPTLDEPFGSLLVGSTLTGDYDHAPTPEKVLCDQTGHRFDPNGSAITVVTAGPSTEASVSFEHYPRWRAEAS